MGGAAASRAGSHCAAGSGAGSASASGSAPACGSGLASAFGSGAASAFASGSGAASGLASAFAAGSASAFGSGVASAFGSGAAALAVFFAARPADCSLAVIRATCLSRRRWRRFSFFRVTRSSTRAASSPAIAASFSLIVVIFACNCSTVAMSCLPG